MRLDKFLGECGIGTRSEIKKMLKKHPAFINGEPIKDPGYILDENKDEISFLNQKLVLSKNRTYLFHKPAGCVTANKDHIHKTVLDYFPKELQKDLNPIGRLDVDTEGLLLLTTDGDLLHRLISPNRNVTKTYLAYLDKPVPVHAIQDFSDGIDIGDDKPTRPAILSILPSTDEIPYSAELTITEGRFHQVKRMFMSVGCTVTYLKRIAESNLTLGDLKPGEYRILTEEELESITKE